MGIRRVKNKGTLAALGRKIQITRELHGISQQEISAKTGISQGTISKVERGLIEPSASNFLLLISSLPDLMDPFEWLRGGWNKLTRKKNGNATPRNGSKNDKRNRVRT